ncbi:metal transporter [Shewanella frigidimarina]|uniref:metal transporter n=1 Tax=Shewanella frigidimarina TaxID=56812 RepID=UPI000F4F433E|nr:metal transporter [Shewanella frigidimarina]RPA59684.1 metal transporter [Shewanella frigidimarina]
MFKNSSGINIGLLAVFICSIGLSHAADNTELGQLLNMSQVRLNNPTQTSNSHSVMTVSNEANLTSSTWLNGLPNISLKHLGSTDNSNIHEQELSLNLPIKSPSLYASDKQLKQLTQAIVAQQRALQGLYLSGLLRQSLWDQRLASVKFSQLLRKATLLNKLYAQQKKLAEVGELPIANSLLLERELIDIDLEKIIIKQSKNEAMTLFTQLTGQRDVPQKIAETARSLVGSSQIENDLSQHPLWQLQVLQQQQQMLIINSQQAGEQDPWTVSLTAKNTSDGPVDDQQLGVGITVPITFGSALSQSELSGWQQSQAEQMINRDRTYLELTNQIEVLRQQQQNLLDQQALLTRALSLSRTITEELAKVKDQSQVSYEVWLRRYMDALDTESRLAINMVMQQQLHSQQLQALGIPL